jgi:hypothetical protein
MINAGPRDWPFLEYPSKTDWKELPSVIQEGYQPSLGARLLARAHALMKQGDLRHALIDGVSACEVALNDFIRQKRHNVESIQKKTDAFLNMPLRGKIGIQLATIATTLGLPSMDIEYALRAIDARNAVVHDAKDPSEEVKNHLLGLLRTTAALLPGPRFRFPSAVTGNWVTSEENWQKEYAKIKNKSASS